MTARMLAACMPDLAAERAHLAALFSDVGVRSSSGDERAGCSVLQWARSGLAHLTGTADGAPLAPAAPVLARVSVIAAAIAGLTAGCAGWHTQLAGGT